LAVVSSIFSGHCLVTITFHYGIHKIGKLKDKNKRMEIGIIEKSKKMKEDLNVHINSGRCFYKLLIHSLLEI
jgi:hypothetical protein